MRVAGLAVVASATLAAPASAQTPLTTQYWFHCAGPVKAQNASPIAPGQAFWNTTAPNASVQGGAGCGFADVPTGGLNPVNLYDAFFSGTHDKAIEKIKVELHSLVSSQARQGETVTFNVKVTEGSGTAWTLLAQRDFTLKGTVENSGSTEKFIAEFTGLKIKASAGRQINITVDTGFPPQPPQAWVFDTTEVPANVTFTAPPPVLP